MTDMKNCAKVKLKTGFFAKTECSLSIGETGLCFEPIDKGSEKTTVASEDIVNVTLNVPRQKMAVQARCGLYEADIDDENDFMETLKTLQENIGAKIICEMN